MNMNMVGLVEKEDALSYIEYLEATGQISKLSKLCRSLLNSDAFEPTGKGNGASGNGRSPHGVAWREKGVIKGSEWKNKKTQRIVTITDHTVGTGGTKVISIGNKAISVEDKMSLMRSTSFSGAENIGFDSKKNSYTPKDWECVKAVVPPPGLKVGYVAKVGDNLREVMRANGFKVA